MTLLTTVHIADGYPDILPKDVVAWLTPDGLSAAWVVTRGFEIVGHVALTAVDPLADQHLVALSARPAADLASIKRLFVSPAARGIGLAKRLLDVAAGFAKSRALQPTLEVTVDSRAVALYERNGWVRIGSQPAAWTRASGEHPLLHLYALP